MKYFNKVTNNSPPPFTALTKCLLLGILLFNTQSVIAIEVNVTVAGNFFKPLKILVTKFKAQSDHKIILSVGSTGKKKVDFNKICSILSIKTLLDRLASSLSGGEKQRVAIARALLTSPRLLLMNEPLSALDHTLKQEMLPYLEGLQQELSIPIIYVSHSPDEVARLADHIVIIKSGKLVKSGALQSVMFDKENGIEFYDGCCSILDATIQAHKKDFLTELLIGTLTLSATQISKPVNSKLRCRINAKDVSLCVPPTTDSSISNVLPGMVTRIEQYNNPGERIITIKISAAQYLLAAISYASTKRLQLKIGNQVWAQIKSVVIL